MSCSPILYRAVVTVDTPEIARAYLHVRIPWWTHLYTIPFLSLYPLLAYAYYVKYDDWLKSEEWTFLACVLLGAGHALSFLTTRWSTGIRAWITCRKVSLGQSSAFQPKLEDMQARSLEDADCIRIVPAEHRGQGEIVSISRKSVSVRKLSNRNSPA